MRPDFKANLPKANPRSANAGSTDAANFWPKESAGNAPSYKSNVSVRMYVGRSRQMPNETDTKQAERMADVKYAMVPIEPTEAMEDIARSLWLWYAGCHSGGTWTLGKHNKAGGYELILTEWEAAQPHIPKHVMSRICYRNMIALAPAPPVDWEKVGPEIAAAFETRTVKDGVTCSDHALHNLEGAIIDIERQDGKCDAVSMRTLKRVAQQLGRIDAALQIPSNAGAGE